MLTLSDGRNELWQWDTGRTLAVDADCSQVHFSNKVFGRSIDVDVVGGKAIIPDVLLQTDKELNVWAFVGTAENGYTKISKTFKVNRRNKPSDYVFTPVEQTTIAEIAAIAQSVRDDADAGLFDGKPGEDGRDGVDGYTPIKGVDYFDGKDGTDGAPGAPGHTPVYGVDYGTPEQIDDIANKAAGILADYIQKISDGKVDKVEGMGLSSNDYDNTAKAKVEAIPEDPKYTDTVYDDTEVKQGLNRLKDDLDKLDVAVFKEVLSKTKKTADVHYYAHCANSGGNTCIIEEVTYNSWVSIYSVEPGQKFEVNAYCMTSKYLSGIVFLYSENLPQKGERYKAIEFNNLGVTSDEYATGTVVVPDGANYMCIRDYDISVYENTVSYAKPYEIVSKIPTKNSELENDSNYYVDNGDISIIKNDIDVINSAVFNYEDVYEVVPQEQYQLITGYCMSGTDEVNGRFTKLLIEPSNVGKKIAILQVKKGEKYKVSGTSYYGLYNALALVLSDTLWDFDTYTTSSRINIIGDDYSLCGGVTESAWRDFVDYEVTIPDGVSYLYLLGNNPRIVKLQTKKISKIDDIDKRISFLDRKKVYEIESAPQVTVGTVTKQHVFSKENRDAYLWEFSEVGSLTIPEIQVNATENDVVGIWVYCNQEMLTQPNNTDGVFSLYVDDVKISEISTAYRLHVGWNYIKLGIKDNDVHAVKFDFTMVRGNYKIAIDTIELNYKTRTQVLLSFDLSSSTKENSIYTKRFPLVDSYGFKATFCNPNDTNISDEQLNEMWKKGWDWSTYGGEGTRPDYDTGTVDEWVEYLNTRINACANRGLFNPVSYFSPANRGSVVLEQALKKVGFKIARVACSENYYLDWFDDKNGLYIYTFGVGGTETAENTLAVLDKAIETGTSICIFTHDVEDELSSEMNCTTKVYTAILEGLKERVDKGLCDVVTFREFYQHWCPEGYAELMENRHEKEKQYILNKLSN